MENGRWKDLKRRRGIGSEENRGSEYKEKEKEKEKKESNHTRPGNIEKVALGAMRHRMVRHKDTPNNDENHNDQGEDLEACIET